MSISVIGIDPGSRITGWGIVEEVSGVLRLIDCGAIRTATSAKTPFAERLASIYVQLAEIISTHKPHEAAIEQVFTAKNAMTALKLGQARGVAVAACAQHELCVFDYEPTLVKKSLVGTGRADKTQVAYMVGRLLNTKTPNTKTSWIADTSDALAVAICHLTMRRFNKLLVTR